MCCTDSLSQISQIANYLEKVKFQSNLVWVISIREENERIGRKMGIFTLLPHSRCMFSTSVPKEKRG